jgi:thermitase
MPLFPLYAIGFLLSALALFGMFYLQRRASWNVRFRRMFFLAFALYLIAALAQKAPFDIKLPVMFRDLMVLGGIGLGLQLLVRKRPSLVLGLAALLLLLSWYYQRHMREAFAPAVDEMMIPLDPNGELLLELKEGVELSTLKSLARVYNLKMERAFHPERPRNTLLDNYYVIDIPDNRLYRLPAIKRALRRLPGVEWVEPNEIVNIEPIPGNSSPGNINRRYGINDPGLNELWGFEQMKVDELYALLKEQEVKPRRKALIAILDTGVDAKHEDLKDNYRSIQSKYDDDPRGHGTHCAGIAAAVSNNGVGVASLSHDNSFVQVASIKVLSAMGSGTQRTIINGIIEAADRGAAVISMSLGGPSNQERQRAYEKAVKYANDAGAIVVAAAGNSNSNARNYSPVNAAGVIGVSAVDQSLRKAAFSNHVADLGMGIAAPGVDIYSTIPGNRYDTYSGTSMATPYVAGMVGLIKSLRPELDTRQVYALLRDTGLDTDDTGHTGKFIQPRAALEALLEK